jgi:hypothetical protein
MATTSLAKKVEAQEESDVRRLVNEIMLDVSCIGARLREIFGDEVTRIWTARLEHKVIALRHFIAEAPLRPMEQVMLLLLCEDDQKAFQLARIYNDDAEAIVDEYIEETCWKNDRSLRALVGNKGSFPERLEALRKAFVAQGFDLWR